MTETSPLCFMDIESDGVHPGRRPWEIAIIRRTETSERTLSIFVDIDLSTADPIGLRVGGFYDRHPVGRWLANVEPADDRPNPYDVSGGFRSRWKAAELVARWTHGAHVVGAVPNFDTETLDRLLRERSLIPAWHYHLIDVESLAVGYLRGQGKPAPKRPWKSDDLMASIGVPTPPEDQRHTALGDARWVMDAYDLVMGGE